MVAFFREWSSRDENVMVAENILSKLSKKDWDLLDGVFWEALQNYHENICLDQRSNCWEAKVSGGCYKDQMKLILDAPQPEFKIPE